MATDPQIPDEAVRAYGRAYDLASIDAQYASDEHLGEDLARVERNAIRAGLAAAYPILAEQIRQEMWAASSGAATEPRRGNVPFYGGDIEASSG